MIIEHANNLTIISDIVNGQRVKMKYTGFKLAECKRLFKSYVKQLKTQKP